MRRFHRPSWIIAVAATIVIALAAIVVFVVLPNRDPDAHHQAAGIATSCGTSIPTASLKTYTFVSGQTTAAYAVHENAVGVDPNRIVIGKTQGVTGAFFARQGDAPIVTGATITVDLNSLQTDSAMRDEDVRNAYLDTYQYPHVQFVSTCVQGLPMTYSTGQAIAFHLIGNLTMHGKTNATDFAVQGQLSGTKVTGTATATIYMTDFGITPPNVLNVTVVENKVKLTVDFTAQSA